MSGETFSFRQYLGAVGSSSLAAGVQTVFYPWLVVGILHQSPSRLGLAQLALLLPNLLFILPGGVISDRRHRGQWLSRLYLLFLIPVAVLLAAAIAGKLSYWLMLVFAVSYGTVSAFVQPARESLLGFVDQDVMHQAVAKVTTAQFLAQGLGYLLGGQLGVLGLETLLTLQLSLYLLSAWFIRRSHPGVQMTVPQAAAPRSESLRELGEGFRMFLSDRRLSHLLLLVAATGFLGFGAYLVATPLLVKQVYHGGAGLLSAMQVTFTLGVVASNLLVMRQKTLFRRAGRLLIASFLLRGLLIGSLSLLPVLWILFPVLLAWGALSGLSMTLGRTILHNRVDHARRSRAASVYQLCLLGGAPIGAAMSGFCIEQIGLQWTLLGLCLVSVLLAGAIALVSPLWREQMQPARR